MKKRLLLLLFFMISAFSYSQDLVVINTDNSAYYIPGTTSTYTVTVINMGPGVATGVTVNNAIPAGIEYFSWTGSNGSSGIYDPLVNTIATLNPGQMVTYIIEMEIPASLTGPLTSEVIVTSTSIDPFPACPACIDTDQKAFGADVEVINTDGQAQYAPGSTVTYTTTVQNNGPLTAANIQFNLALPAAITAYTWSGTNGSGASNSPVNNIIPSLLPGESVVYTTTFVVPAGFTGNLTTTASATSPTFDPVPGCTQCVDTDIQGSGADLTTTLTDGQTLYTDPGTNTYTLTITNNGPAAATDVHVVNLIPAGIPATNYDWYSNISTSGTDSGIDEIIPTIGVGQTVTYTITLTVPAGLTADIVNQVSVTSTSTDPTPACDACTDTDTYTFGADLVITNSDGNVTYVPGSNNVYTVTVTNLGPNDATGVVVSNLIPAGITAFSWSGSNGSSGSNVPLADNIATLTVGSTVTYTITLGVPSGFTGPLTSVVNVTSTSTDPNPACTACSDTDTQALTGADINVTKTDGSIGYTPGTIRSYTITIVNNGPEEAQDVVVSDPVPANVPSTNVSWTGPNGSGTGAVSENLGTLTVGQVVTYTVNVVVPADYPQDQNLVNTVDVTSTTPDPNPDCFRCTDTDIPFPMADVVTFKTDGSATFTDSPDDDDPLNPQMWTYVVTITNLGPSAANNVSVYDPLPAGIAIMEWSGNGKTGSGVLNDVIPSLQVGEVITYQVSVHIPAGYSDTHTNLVNTVIVNSDTPDQNPTCPGCTDNDTADDKFVTVTTNQFTLQELVEDVLIHSDCANVSNFSSLGFVANSNNSTVGYFETNNADFPLTDGVVIATTRAGDVDGHYTGSNGNVSTFGGSDTDLEYVSDTNPYNEFPGTDINNVSYVQFDFVPYVNEFSFDFLFASEEYEVFQCGFGDVFAFLLTDLDQPLVPGTNPVNIAVIPDLLPPTLISVFSIRDEAYNGGCDSVNPEWFGQMNSQLPAAVTPINLRGQVLPMKAKATVIPNHNYRIKLAIGNYSDTQVQSAVFLEAGSFNVGQTDIAGQGFELDDFPNLTGDAAACIGDTRTLEAGASAIPGATYAWYLNDLLIPDETGYTLVVDEPGVYTVNVSVNGGCQQTDDITVEYRPENVLFGNPDTLEECQGTPFNLTLINPEILNGQTGYGIQFHHSAEDAVYLVDPILNYTAYNGFDGEIIYASIEDQTGAAPCISVRPFTLVTLDCGNPTDPADLFECDDDGVADGTTDFDISGIPAEVLGSNIAANYTITIHETLIDAQNDGPSIPATTYTGSNGQILYVRFENNTDPTDVDVVDFVLNVGIVPTGTVAFDVPEACVGAASPQATFTIVGGTPPYDIVYNIGGADIPLTISSNTAVIPIDTVVPGTVTATLVSVTDNTTSCTSTPGTSATVTINPVADASLTASATSICEGEPGINIWCGTNGVGTPPFTFTYQINGGPLQMLTSATGTEAIVLPSVPGDYDVHLTEVSDANCTRAKDETISVTVYSLPEAAVVSDVTTLCDGSGAFQLTFTGSNGEAPYSFSYEIDGIAQTPVSTLAGQDSVTVPVSGLTPGDHDILVTNIADAHCTQGQNDLVTVTVNPLPEATIASNVAAICQGSNPMTVTFTGSNGTAPYTFNYLLNGVAGTATDTNPTVTIDTSISGPVHIVLVDVSDANCTNPQGDILDLDVWTLPTATIVSSATQVCQNSDEPTVTFTASSGNAPYTFNFEIDGAADSYTTIGTETQHIISIPTDAVGPVTVHLTSISDVNGCIRQINQTVSVTVVGAPVIPSFPVLHVCDDNND
ncbi:choice-of-anchor L domain-containing protein, partial [Flavobacterium silvaticum]